MESPSIALSVFEVDSLSIITSVLQQKGQTGFWICHTHTHGPQNSAKISQSTIVQKLSQK